MLTVNGVKFPPPSKFKVGVQDISKAERVASGRMVIDRVATKVKLDMAWNYMTPEDLSRVLNIIDNVTFTVVYLDPRSNSMQTREFYVGDRGVPMYMYRGGNPIYTDITFNFIEI